VSLYFDNLRISLVIIGKLKWLKLSYLPSIFFSLTKICQEMKLNNEKVI
jgi:hypothetical protein